MSGLWINVLILVACVIVVVMAFLWAQGDDEVWFLTGLAASVVGLIALIVLMFCTLAPRHDRTACDRWGEAAERETKFVRPTYWEWDCLVRTDEGWTSRDNVMKVDE